MGTLVDLAARVGTLLVGSVRLSPIAIGRVTSVSSSSGAAPGRSVRTVSVDASVDLLLAHLGRGLD